MDPIITTTYKYMAFRIVGKKVVYPVEFHERYFFVTLVCQVIV